MAIREVLLNPRGDMGYGMFLELPTHIPQVIVFTKLYVQKLLPVTNQRLVSDYVVPEDHDPVKIVQFTHSIFTRQGYIDRTPRLVERVDHLYDFKENETDPNKMLVDIEKYYNVDFNGTLLRPAYPQLLPMPHLPLPTFPL